MQQLRTRGKAAAEAGQLELTIVLDIWKATTQFCGVEEHEVGRVLEIAEGRPRSFVEGLATRAA